MPLSADHPTLHASSSSPEELLAEELRNSRLLRDLSVTLVTGDGIQAITGELLDAAIQITGADFGSMQVLRRADAKLELLASSGFDEATVGAWKLVPADACAAGARALATEQRYNAPEIAACELMQGTATAAFYAAVGIRAVQYTPLVSRSGRIVGLLATHWREPRDSDEREFVLLDVVARQAADLIERQQAEEALKKTEVDYRTLFNSIDEGFCIFEMIFDSHGRAVDYRFLKVNPAFERHTGLCDAVGKTMREFAPAHEEHWFEIYGRVAMTGEPVRFERPASQLGGQWFDLYAFRVGEPEQRQVAVVFNNITSRKRADEELRQARDELEERVEQRTMELRAQADQLRHLATELTRSEQRERSRMAELLHDHVQQLLVSAKMRCEGLRRRAGDKPEDLNVVVDLLGECLGSLRSLTVELSPPVLSEGLAPALEWLGGVWMKDKHELVVKLHLDWSVDAANHDIRSLVFLAVRELLFNVVKHSGVKEANVELAAQDATTLRVTVRDGGKGFDPKDIALGKPGRSGLGLFTIRERIEMLGGSLEVRSAAGQGVEVVILVPRGVDSAASHKTLLAARPIPPQDTQPPT